MRVFLPLTATLFWWYCFFPSPGPGGYDRWSPSFPYLSQTYLDNRSLFMAAYSLGLQRLPIPCLSVLQPVQISVLVKLRGCLGIYLSSFSCGFNGYLITCILFRVGPLQVQSRVSWVLRASFRDSRGLFSFFFSPITP